MSGETRIKQRIYFRCEVVADDTTFSKLRLMGANGLISADSFYVRGNCAIMVLNQQDIEVLQKMGLKVKVGIDLIERAQLVKKEINRSVPMVDANGIQTGFVDKYLDTNGIIGRFQLLQSQFPALTKLVDLPHQTSGYDGSHAALKGPATVKLFRVNTTPQGIAKPGLLLIAGTHSREWVPPLAAIEFAEQILRNYAPGSANPEIQKINQIVEGLDILIVPAMNSDGINYSHHDYAMWRKNRRSNPSSVCRGIDVNRNYSIYWGGGGSSGDPCNDSYRGASAFTEPENRNILSIVEQYPNILTGVDCHSAGETFYRPQPTGGIEISLEPVGPRDNAIYLSLEAAMNAAISSVSPGKTYYTGTTNNHAGTSDEYLFFAHRIFAFDIECAQDFQPPISDALVAAQEVAAALRALAEKTLSLSGQFNTPVSIVHVIDKSGSMVASGYADPTKTNAKRMIDLMSFNDSAGIVSFNESSKNEMSLTNINGPSVYSTARNAVDSINFGGWTSIGSGLQMAGTFLSGANNSKSIVLLSDGYQNRTPWVADILPNLPSGTKVYTIALGPQSDQALMESIAHDTGGNYYFSPDELELFEIYNYISADTMDVDIALNDTLTFSGSQPKESMEKQVIIDEGADYATFSVSWDQTSVKIQVTLSPPQGIIAGSSGLRQSIGTSYAILRVRRPHAGIWTVKIQKESGAVPVKCTVAAFLRSNLRLHIMSETRGVIGEPMGLLVQVKDGVRLVEKFEGTTNVAHVSGSIDELFAKWKEKLPAVPNRLKSAQDTLPDRVLQYLVIRDTLKRRTGQDPVRFIRSLETKFSPGTGFAETKAASIKKTNLAMSRLASKIHPAEIRGTSLVSYPTTSTTGTYNLKVRVEGVSPISGSSFVRVGLRSIRIV